jgi:hypothetical protein
LYTSLRNCACILVTVNKNAIINNDFFINFSPFITKPLT